MDLQQGCEIQPYPILPSHMLSPTTEKKSTGSMVRASVLTSCSSKTKSLLPHHECNFQASSIFTQQNRHKMAVAPKKIVVCGGNGFLGTYLPTYPSLHFLVSSSHLLTDLAIFQDPESANPQCPAAGP